MNEQQKKILQNFANGSGGVAPQAQPPEKNADRKEKKTQISINLTEEDLEKLNDIAQHIWKQTKKRSNYSRIIRMVLRAFEINNETMASYWLAKK